MSHFYMTLSSYSSGAVASSLAFTVIATDDTALSWGDASYGGDSSGVTLTNIAFVFANNWAFTALSHTDIATGTSRTAVTDYWHCEHEQFCFMPCCDACTIRRLSRGHHLGR